MPLAAEKLTPCTGTGIKTDIATLLSGTHAAELRALLEERGVLVFRELHMDDRQQLEFTRTLGNMREEIRDGAKDGIMVITVDPGMNSRANYIRGSFHWHIDGTHEDVPPRASLLSGRRLSEIGGQTEFANTYAAFEALPEEERLHLQGLKVVHSLLASMRVLDPDMGEDELALARTYAPKTHPLIWTHRSGRKSFVLGCHADYVEGMGLEEGRALLARLQAWAAQPRFVYRHEWKLGDLVIWDNTGTMHRVEPYALDSGRTMHRTTLLGEEALV